ncbi:MAG: septum formation protein Maf [Caulobacteraceae bacterium]|nr:septum formation protein Maf [Caulobacteraceae bacterium]
MSDLAPTPSPGFAQAVILASTSSVRRGLLTAAGVAYEARSPGVDEDLTKKRLLENGATPKDVAEALAAEKALAVSAAHPRALVIGADQTLDLEGALFDKVGSLDEARQRLLQLKGRRHQLHAALAVARHGKVIWRQTSSPSLTMRDFSEPFLDAWLARQGATILGSVGCYRLEDEGVQLFDEIDGDYFAILGLPLTGLLALLREEGVLIA